MLTKPPMKWNVVLIGIIVFSGTSSYACDDGRFWGHCQRNELCVCIKNNWYQTTTSEIKKVDSTIESFSLICSCPNTDTNQAVDCLYNFLYTSDSTTLTATVNHETTFMTASENTVKNQATTVGKTIMNWLSTTLSSTEKPGSTFIKASIGHTFQNHPTSGAMCPCSCEYFDKIEYWSQEANQIKQYNELSQELAQIKNILKMETKNLTAYLNTKKSVGDKRPSSRATGYVGGVILVLILCCLVLLDILKCSHLKNM
uniref:Uncharacterized protein n=1 Tax=Magallana gigas TaxID=29159 RepID=A0A8W8M9F8_MAGGI